MEKSEPSLVPQWLKNGGSSIGGNSPLHPDDHAASKAARNKSFVHGNGHDFRRSTNSERTTSSYFRRSSSINSSGNFRSYNSFGRNHQEKVQYDSRDQEKSVLRDRWHRDLADPLGNALLGKFERDGLRRSQSMISGKRSDAWPNKIATDSNSGSGKNTNGFLTKVNSGGAVNKLTSEKDFPSLGADERTVVSEVGRVPSPGLSTAIHSLPIGTSSTMGSEKWTSALAEVPVLVGNNGTALQSGQHSSTTSSTPVTLASTTGLNMAEAVVQGPSRAQTTPQLSETQRLEELVKKQSRQLIPVTPTLPKTMVFNSSDKQKNKVGLQQPPPSVCTYPVNFSHRGGPVKADVSKTSTMVKLQVLKPIREKNGATPAVKDSSNPSGSSSVAARGLPNNTVPDRKASLTGLDKRPTSQAQSRNDFFNLVRKKSMANSSGGADSAATNSISILDPGTSISQASLDKRADSDEVLHTSNYLEVVDAPVNDTEKTDSTCNGDACGDQKCVSGGKKHLIADPIISEEEETAFLRSLGWEENNDEGALTEDEINTFYKDFAKYMDSKPASDRTLQGIQPKFLLPFDSQITDLGDISSGLNSSSDDKLKS